MKKSESIRIPTADEVAALDPETRAAMAAAYLGGLEPGRQPRTLFTELARLSVISTVEVVPLLHDQEDDRTQVLLTQRPLSNDWWSGMWHVPGVVLLSSDKKDDKYGYADPVERLFSSELNSAVSLVGDPQILRGRFAEGPRGTESSLIHWAEVALVEGKSLPENARFFDAEHVLNDPPAHGFIAGHADQVADAVTAYSSR